MGGSDCVEMIYSFIFSICVTSRELPRTFSLCRYTNNTMCVEKLKQFRDVHQGLSNTEETYKKTSPNTCLNFMFGYII